jgi:hypothetical protein
MPALPALLAHVGLMAETAGENSKNPVSTGGRVTFDPATSDAVSEVVCRQVPAWVAQPREWMTRRGDWCSVEVHFEYPGSGGDIDLVVSRRSASGRAAPSHHASVDLPGNGGVVSEFQFIFPCPKVAREQLCLSYASTTDADELSYDFLELGVDARPAERAVVEGASNSTVLADATARGSASSILRQDIEEQLASIEAAVFTPPAPAPIDRLRKRPR